MTESNTRTTTPQRGDRRISDEEITTTTFGVATRLVAGREILTYLRGKGYWIETAAYVVGILALTILPSLFGGDDPKVAVVGAQAERLVIDDEMDVRQVGDPAGAERLVRQGEVDAALVPDGESATGVRVVALEEAPTDLIAGLNTAPPVDLLEPGEVNGGVRYLVTFVFALVFFMFGMGGTAIAQSVVTEKQTRVVEILVSAIPTRALLAGKVLGHTVLVFAQVVVFAVVTPLALRVGGHHELLGVIAPALGWFVPFFILGFVLLSSMWAVAGSLISRQEDLGKVMAPLMMVLLGPYMLVASMGDNDLVMRVLSYIPFSAPVAMPVRLFTGDAAGWEPFAALLVLIATVVVTVLTAARLYSGSLLQLGTKVKLADAWVRSE